MKTLLLAAVCVMSIMVTMPRAQLLQPNSSGLTMGVIVLNVSDVAAHKKFWVDAFDAKVVKVGQLEGATVPGFVILFRPHVATRRSAARKVRARPPGAACWIRSGWTWRI